MGFFKDIISNLKYRRKKFVTPVEFLEATQISLERKLDPESTLFFRHHPNTVNLVHNILQGRLKQSDDKKKNGLVIQALITDITEYTPSIVEPHVNSPEDIAEIIEEFAKSYKDAGEILGKAFVLFFELT
ncbi:MAG: hypothetical protein MUO63_15875 [Desulfobulbaceae bacterium]|nr:hypothetical protein [Desulfobulbaceae bacterium]